MIKTHLLGTIHYLNWDTIEDEWSTNNSSFEENNHRNQGVHANMIHNQFHLEFIERVCPSRALTCVPFMYP